MKKLFLALIAASFSMAVPAYATSHADASTVKKEHHHKKKSKGVKKHRQQAAK